MSKAREIAEERLARGEISNEEFQQIISNISSSSSNKETHTDSGAQDAVAKAHTSASNEDFEIDPFWKYVFGGVGLYLVLATIHSFIIPKSDAYEMSISSCGNRSPMCKCLAKSFQDDLSFLKRPLIWVGISEPGKGSVQRCVSLPRR